MSQVSTIWTMVRRMMAAVRTLKHTFHDGQPTLPRMAVKSLLAVDSEVRMDSLHSARNTRKASFCSRLFIACCWSACMWGFGLVAVGAARPAAAGEAAVLVAVPFTPASSAVDTKPGHQATPSFLRAFVRACANHGSSTTLPCQPADMSKQKVLPSAGFGVGGAEGSALNSSCGRGGAGDCVGDARHSMCSPLVDTGESCSVSPPYDESGCPWKALSRLCCSPSA